MWKSKLWKRGTCLLLAVCLAVSGVAPALTLAARGPQRRAELVSSSQSSGRPISPAFRAELRGRLHAELAPRLRVEFAQRAAEAGVPVWRLDSIIDIAIEAIENYVMSFIENIVTSLTDIHSLADLINLPNKLMSIVKNFNIGNMLRSMVGEVLGAIFEPLIGAITDQIAGFLNGLGDQIAELAGGALDGLFGNVKKDLQGIGFDFTGKQLVGEFLSGLLKSGNFSDAAKGVMSLVGNGIAKKVQERITESMNDFDAQNAFSGLIDGAIGGIDPSKPRPVVPTADMTPEEIKKSVDLFNTEWSRMKDPAQSRNPNTRAWYSTLDDESRRALKAEAGAGLGSNPYDLNRPWNGDTDIKTPEGKKKWAALTPEQKEDWNDFFNGRGVKDPINYKELDHGYWYNKGETPSGQKIDPATGLAIDNRQPAKTIADQAKELTEGKTMPDGSNLSGSSLHGAVPDKEDVSDAAHKGAEAAAQAFADYAKTYPMSQPSVQATTAMMAVRSIADAPNRDLMAMTFSEHTKVPIVSRIASLVAKYKAPDGKKSQFDEMLEEYSKNNQELAEQAADGFSGGGDGDALRYIAGMMGTQVQQVALTNSVLISINRTLADEISMLEQIAYMNIEGYAKDISTGISNTSRIYEQLVATTR